MNECAYSGAWFKMSGLGFCLLTYFNFTVSERRIASTRVAEQEKSFLLLRKEQEALAGLYPGKEVVCAIGEGQKKSCAWPGQKGTKVVMGLTLNIFLTPVKSAGSYQLNLIKAGSRAYGHFRYG